MQHGSGDIGLVDVLIVLAKRKRLVLGLPLAAALTATAISFALPPAYRASTTILPPQQSQGGAAALLSQLGGAGGMVASATGIKNPNDLYVGMLQSRRVADVLVQRFALREVYDTPSFEKARKMLAMRTSIVAGKDSMITVTVQDGDRERVAQLANSYISELVGLTRSLAITEAAQRRAFYERQLEQAKDNLASAEQEMKKALDTRGVISVDSESRALVETMGRLRAQISLKEIQFDAMKAFVTPRHQDYKRAQEELVSLRAELGRLENGRGTSAGGSSGREGLENIKILRDVKYNQTLYELLAKQYEVARLDEARDAPVVQVLDAAVAPERKSSPQPVLIGIATGVIALFVAIALALAGEFKTRMDRNAAFRQKWAELGAHLRLRA